MTRVLARSVIWNCIGILGACFLNLHSGCQTSIEANFIEFKFFSGQEPRIEGSFVGGIFERKGFRHFPAEIGGKVFENSDEDPSTPERHFERRRFWQGEVGEPGARPQARHREEVERSQVQRGKFFQTWSDDRGESPEVERFLFSILMSMSMLRDLKLCSLPWIKSFSFSRLLYYHPSEPSVPFQS